MTSYNNARCKLVFCHDATKLPTWTQALYCCNSISFMGNQKFVNLKNNIFGSGQGGPKFIPVSRFFNSLFNFSSSSIAILNS